MNSKHFYIGCNLVSCAKFVLNNKCFYFALIATEQKWVYKQSEIPLIRLKHGSFLFETHFTHFYGLKDMMLLNYKTYELFYCKM